MRENLYFIGPGRAGLSLGQALWDAGAASEIVYCGRRPDPPVHPLFTGGIARYQFGLEPPGIETSAVFLAVPDDVLTEMAHALAGQGSAPAGCAAYHLSGALSAEVLAPLHARGYAVGTFHLLQSLADPPRSAARIPGSWAAISGEPAAVATARRLLDHLGCRPLAIPVPRRPFYHAASVSASNHVTALVALAGRLLVQAGIPEEDALPALLPLVRGTLDTLESAGLRGAVAGPLARGDIETLRLHLRSLDAREREVYRCLALELLEVAASLGLDGDVREEVGGLLKEGEAR